MKMDSLKNCALLFSMLLLLGACGGGTNNAEDTNNTNNTDDTGGNNIVDDSNTEQNAAKCSTQLLAQLCGTTWVSDCIDQVNQYTQITMTFGDDETFSYTGRNYSDAACTTEISSLAYSGGISEGGDIALIDGSTGRKVDLSIDLYDGNVVNPPTMQYTIMQIDTGNASILYMGDTNDTATERDGNNRVRSSIPYRKQ